MTGFRKVQNWGKGSNNVDNPERLPEGFARSIVNMDTVPGGRLTLREGLTLVYQDTARAILSLGKKLLIADGEDLVEFDTGAGTTRVIRQIAGDGPMCGDVLNDTLYFCTTNEALEYNGSVVRRWGVQDATNLLVCAPVSGGLQPGYYKVAVTFTDEYGREGGTAAPLIYYAETGFTVDIPQPPAGHQANLYVGSVNGAALYLQQTVSSAQTFTVNVVRDDTQALGTFNLYAPTPSSIVRAHNGVLAMARGGVLEITKSMRPHLVDRVRGFFQYPAEIGEVISAGGLFVSADKQYVLLSAETQAVTQRELLDYPAIAGTGVKLPSGAGSWSSIRGQIVLEGDEATLLTERYFVPAPASAGAAGVIDSNGSPRVIVTTNEQQGPNQLAAADFFDAEIKLP